MTPDQATQLAELLSSTRQQLGLTAREVARRAGVDAGTVTRIERGEISQPKPESLKAIGEVLGISAADLFAVTDLLPRHELPTFTPYMRAKYKDLPDEAVAEMETYLDRISRKYGSGPQGGEDEIP